MSVKLVFEDGIRASTETPKDSPLFRFFINTDKISNACKSAVEILNFYKSYGDKSFNEKNNETRLKNLTGFILNAIIKSNFAISSIDSLLKTFTKSNNGYYTNTEYTSVEDDVKLLNSYKELSHIKEGDVNKIYSLIGEFFVQLFGKDTNTKSIRYYCIALRKLLALCTDNIDDNNVDDVTQSTEVELVFNDDVLNKNNKELQNICKELNTVLNKASDLLKKLIQYSEQLKIDINKTFTPINIENTNTDTNKDTTTSTESYKPVTVKNKNFESAQEAYNNMLLSGKLAKRLREYTIENITEKDLSRAHEDRRSGYNRIDLTHKNGTPLSIFVYYNDKLMFRIEAYDNFGGVISGQVDLHLTRGTISAFLDKVGNMINSLAKQADKGNVLSEED